MKFFLVSWPDFLSKIVKNGQILVRFFGKIGQILANFSQILILSTLPTHVTSLNYILKKPFRNLTYEYKLKQTLPHKNIGRDLK